MKRIRTIMMYVVRDALMVVVVSVFGASFRLYAIHNTIIMVLNRIIILFMYVQVYYYSIAFGR